MPRVARDAYHCPRRGCLLPPASSPTAILDVLSAACERVDSDYRDVYDLIYRGPTRSGPSGGSRPSSKSDRTGTVASCSCSARDERGRIVHSCPRVKLRAVDSQIRRAVGILEDAVADLGRITKSAYAPERRPVPEDPRVGNMKPT
jgi:hypothetical protein